MPRLVTFWILAVSLAWSPAAESAESLMLTWENNILSIHGQQIPGGKLPIWYLEAYCRDGSTDREWSQTVIGHRTELVSRTDDGTQLVLRCRLKDGVVVTHKITSGGDEVDFRLVVHNPTDTASRAHWAQPCIRVGEFTGCDQETYLPKCFVFLRGGLQRMPTSDWATQARYKPGQVWAAPRVDRNDVNPRPLNKTTPANGLIGCYSVDDKLILATAWRPYQELFQGVITCLHSDFRIGGLKPNEKKQIHGKIYIVPANVDRLLARYKRDFAKNN